VDARSHVCLIGSSVCQNWALVQRLIPHHALTLLTDFAPEQCRLLEAVDLVVLDCRQHGGAGSAALVQSLRRTANFPIVVLDGGLCRAEIAQLFHVGAQDYFSEPLNTALIAERIHGLADSNHVHRNRREKKT
jgi:DNA-binding response OmpR family regulator